MNRIATLTINSANNVTTEDVTATAISQTSGTGTTTFNGSINTSGIAGINLSGTSFAVNGSVLTTGASGAGLTITNSGTLSFGSSANLNIAGPISQNGSGSVSLQGLLKTGNSATFQGPVSIVSLGMATVDSSPNNNPIDFLNTVDGPGSLSCSLGSGNLTFDKEVGSGISLAALTINSAGNATTKDVTAGSITQTAGSGLTTFNGDITSNDIGGINLTGTAFTFVGNATSAGPISINNMGSLIIPLGSIFSSMGPFNQSGTGAVTLAGTVETTNQDLSFSGPITLTASTVLNSGSGSGDINISSSIDGAQSLTMTAGSGDVNVVGDIGSNVRLGDVVIVSAYDVNLASLYAASFTQESLANQFTLIGAFDTNGSKGISLTGNKFSRQGSLVTTNGGNLTFLNTGAVTGAPGNTANISGQWLQLPGSTGTVNLGGTISAAGGFTIISPFSLVGDATLDASGGTGGVSIANTVDGAHSFTIIAGGGNVSITQPIGASTALSSFTINGNQVSLSNIGGISQGVTGTTSITATGAIQFTGTTYNAGAQTYIAPTQFDMVGGSLTTLSSNGAALLFQNGKILLGNGTDLTINTTGGTLTTASIRAGSGSGRNLILSSGSGDIVVGSVGLAGDAEFASASLTGNNITLGSALIANAITFAPSTRLNIGGNITSTNTPISIPSAVVLNTNSIISTGSGANITFSGTVDG